jgi:hypothetical protein
MPGLIDKNASKSGPLCGMAAVCLTHRALPCSPDAGYHLRLPVMRTLHTLPLLSMATSNIPPCALYRSMTAAIIAATITMAPTTNQFLCLVRTRAARESCCCVSCAARWAAHRVSFSCCVS